MTNVVMDASAMLALLNEEPGAKQVEKLLDRAIMSTVNVSEVMAVLSRVEIPPAEAQKIVHDLIIESIDFDSEQALIAAELFKKTKKIGLSLGDRACLSLAIQQDLPVYTADKAWQKVSIRQKIHLIRS